VIVEADGGPLGAVVAGANVHDCKLLEQTIDAIVVDRPKPTKKSPQNLCLDKGYDNPTGRTAAVAQGHTPHIRRIGEEKLDAQGRKRRKARRWVVERTLGWMSKCRGILIRYAKKSCNYLGLIQLCSGLLWYRRQYRLALLR
jgi:putative transposase